MENKYTEFWWWLSLSEKTEVALKGVLTVSVYLVEAKNSRFLLSPGVKSI